MEANLLPCNAAVRLQARTRFPDVLRKNLEGHYGKGHRVLRPAQLPEKTDEMDSAGTTWEINPVQFAIAEEISMNGHYLLPVGNWLTHVLCTLRDQRSGAPDPFPRSSRAVPPSEGVR
jgi:hypothetical protein